MKRIVLATAALLGLVAASGPGAAQSFNCNYARTADEVAICQDGRLSALDERMSSIYFGVRNRLYGGARAQLEAEQADWLASRRDCGRDFGCIDAAYRRRIRELAQY